LKIGPFGANIFNPRDWGGASDETTNTITLELTRVVLAIGVFAIGVELPKAYMFVLPYNTMICISNCDVKGTALEEFGHAACSSYDMGPYLNPIKLMYCG
jgi:hypothetical protein